MDDTESLLPRDRVPIEENAFLQSDEIVARVRAKYDLLRVTAQRGDAIVSEIVTSYSADLDAFIDTFSDYLDSIRDGTVRDFADSDLQRMVARIPILLYRLSEKVDVASIESDVAKAARDNVYSRNYIDAPGRTIPEKQAYASVITADEAAIVDLSRHVYARLKSKIENGNLLFDGVRKIMSTRDTERTVFGREMKR